MVADIRFCGLAYAQQQYFDMREVWAKQRRGKKLGVHDHKGVAFYDRERLKRKLPPHSKSIRQRFEVDLH